MTEKDEWKQAEVTTDDDGKPLKIFKHVGDPIVGFDTRNPDKVWLTVETLEGKIRLRFTLGQGDLLHYRLGRALHSAETPTKFPSDFL